MTGILDPNLSKSLCFAIFFVLYPDHGILMGKACLFFFYTVFRANTWRSLGGTPHFCVERLKPKTVELYRSMRQTWGSHPREGTIVVDRPSTWSETARRGPPALAWTPLWPPTPTATTASYPVCRENRGKVAVEVRGTVKIRVDSTLHDDRDGLSPGRATCLARCR